MCWLYLTTYYKELSGVQKTMKYIREYINTKAYNFQRSNCFSVVTIIDGLEKTFEQHQQVKEFQKVSTLLKVF